ncbi:MAG: histidine phosphatase family protein [Gammaproteobacteria bacterium]
MKPRLWLVRHGETEWSADGRHTGSTDIPLTERGREQAAALGRALKTLDVQFTKAYVSPLGRTRETARLVGFADAEPMDDLHEWDYGEFEGRKTSDIRKDLDDPHWLIWNADIREGETPEDVGKRADRARGLLMRSDGDVIVFSHGHFLRMFAARWMELPARAGQHLALDTGTISILGFEHEYQVITRWNAPLDEERMKV